MNDFVEIHKIIDITLRRLWLVILLAMAAAAIGYVVSQHQPRVYEATTTIMIGQLMQANELSRTDLLTNEVLAQTYADMALRQPVLQGVIDTLDLPQSWRELKSQIRAKFVDGTQLIQITAEANSTMQALTLTDEVARQLILLSAASGETKQDPEESAFVSQQLASLQTKIELGRRRLQSMEATMVAAFETQSIAKAQESQTAIDTLAELISNWESDYTQLVLRTRTEDRSNVLTIIEAAQANLRPIRPRTDLNIFLAGAVGFLLALGLILFRELRDDRLKSTTEVEHELGITALGAINNIAGKQEQDKLLLFQDPAAPSWKPTASFGAISNSRPPTGQ
ncbi:MAG: Wzz/FepE/Etk N-terminal domain-containing protein [Caldilineaceae bacterium]